jgi:hypothetical protein
MIFVNQGFQKLNLLKGFFIALPFLIFLIYKMLWLEAAAALLASLLVSQVSLRSVSNFKVATPFKKWPFEFIIGFRKSFLVLALLYFLIFKAIQVDNPNLGLACLGFIFLLSISFYGLPEDELFVWINMNSPKAFLLQKIRAALICSSILALPALILALIFFTRFYIAAISIILVGYLYLSIMILTKYAAFPKEINLPQALILGFSFIFPPLLIYSIPAFYRKAIRQLQPILEC